MFRSSSKAFFIVLGCLSLALGVIGIVLPVLPTTPFILLAAYCFGRSSEKLHAWLLSRPKLGKLILDWEKHGVIRIPAKVLAVLMIVLLFSYSLFFTHLSIWIKGVIACIGVGVLAFILSRPSRPLQRDHEIDYN